MDMYDKSVCVGFFCNRVEWWVEWMREKDRGEVRGEKEEGKDQMFIYSE